MKTQNTFAQGYQMITKAATSQLPKRSTSEWSKKGDNFVKFTLYNDTTPVKASTGTIIVK